MRILQTADNHIGGTGETAYSRIDPSTGLIARGFDFLISFKNISRIAIDQRVDVLLIVGDFFTRVSPHPRYIVEVMKELQKLSKVGIVTVIVSGNHETPKISTTINPLNFLAQMDNVHVVLEPKTIEISGIDFVCIPALPFFDEIKSSFNSLLELALKNSKSPNKILAAHLPLGQALKCSEETMETFMGECVDISQIPNIFSHVALGHMHRYQKLQQNDMSVVYSGSSEKCQWGEENDEKFVVLLDISEKVTIKPIKIPVRYMLTVMNLDCTGLNAEQINKQVLEAIDQRKDKIKDAVVRINLDKINLTEYRLVDLQKIKESLFACGAFDCKIQRLPVNSFSSGGGANDVFMFSASKELELFIKEKVEYKKIAKKLLKTGKEIINEARATTN